MNKSFIRSFAVNARNELMERVQQKSYELGISEDKIKKARIESSDALYINGKALDPTQVKQRNSLIEAIRSRGYKRVIEEVAYTWFNRFCALRYLEVNNYLPSKTRVLSSTVPDSVEPDIMREALHLDLDIDKNKVINFKEENDSNSLFKYLLIKQCNSLNKILPFLFEPVEDYSEILFPDNLLQEGSFLRAMTDPENIPEEDWQDVEIIGWLYQYYISEKKDQVFAELKKNIKISPENIPAATQLFTPHWIVRYLVENSLGRLWMLNHPESRLLEQMDYYIKPESSQPGEPPFLIIRSPEEIKICDPACGSGHMLVYAFDLLYAIYEECGYQAAEIPGKILAHNLYGMEIDKRAGELAAFALTMKARSKYRRFFRQPVPPHICILQNIPLEKDELQSYMDEVGENLFTAELNTTLGQFEEADNFGSLIRPRMKNVSDVRQLLEDKDLGSNLFLNATHGKVLKALQQADYLSTKYHVVIANPPYMGGRGMNGRLKVFAEKNYPDSKSDLFAMFMERNLDLAVEQGAVSMITMQSWMFLSSFGKLREKILDEDAILSMAHLGARAFDSIGGEVVSTTAFVIEKSKHPNYKSAYLRLVEGNCEADKEKDLKLNRMNPYYASAADFKKIPGSPIAYWISNTAVNNFKNLMILEELSEAKSGMSSCNSDLFLRRWFEVSFAAINKNCKSHQDANESTAKWYPYNKGGGNRRWFGYNDTVINWENEGEEIKYFVTHNHKDPETTHWSRRLFNLEYFFREGLTWSAVSSGRFSCRKVTNGVIPGTGSKTLYDLDKNKLSIVYSILNTKVASYYLNVFSPTLNFEAGDVIKIPITKSIDHNKIFSHRLFVISRLDWDSYETSWDFTRLPLLQAEYHQPYLQESYSALRKHWREMTREMQQLEEENNRIFIEAYGLQDELSPEVPLNEITLTCNPYYRYAVNKPDEELEALLLLDTIKEYISYAVGCMLGRYSLDKEGLVFAGGEFDPRQYKSFPADQDNVIPILAEDYFQDDIVTRFAEFVRLTFSATTLEENLDYIADTLGRRSKETARDTIRRYFVNDFYKDHVQRYKKRPIYWLFTSGKEKAFNCLVYLHRYQPDTIATLRTEYLHRLQEAVEVEKQQQQRIIAEEAGSSSARRAAKRLLQLDRQLLELKNYDELVHHYADMRISLDLDDGVKVNYAKLQELLAKI
ncbi:BREX-1 system adenine-specific DNA-methyltransferase PglX [Syntrophomonas wolfei]|mgnify:CR=1 FL=1|uniref:BREX-1 system adenine-specific DNA-methyltransferase PglX n=1 Tax=Syntrophomonas wolfei TaxID=863 RepID=UPI0023F3FACA|nr:BREX-1 system adenine-specific DNA-methyltransferase PglX [Syntrophomonas wolfei]